MNVEADWESRHCLDSSEWKLAPRVFRKICLILGQPDIDLFASRLSHQLQNYMSWKPDPGSRATDALSQTWTHWYGYAFPPFCLIGRVLSKVRKDGGKLILVTPVWQAQYWYSLLLEMSVRNPLLLPQHKDLLKNPMGQNHPLSEKKCLSLAVWVVSGNVWLQKAYRRKLQSLSANPSDQVPYQIMSLPGANGFAGVIHDKLIPFEHL